MSDLRKALFEASPDVLAVLCRQHRQEIVDQFPDWTVVPDSLRSDAAAAEDWGAALLRIGEQLQQLDEPGPMAWLRGEGRDNPIEQWQMTLMQADQLSAAGHSGAAIEALRPVLDSLEGSAGAIVDDLLAKARGKMAAALLDLGDIGGARTFMRAALETCEATGDLAGMWTYRDNLDLLDAVTADESLATLRARLAEAQDLSDTGRYLASNEILAELAQREDIDRYAGKLCGLIGLNLHRLGDVDGARQWTQAAGSSCREANDWHGVIIYGENLRVIDESAQPRE